MLALPVMLELLVAVEHRIRPEIHRTHVQRGQFQLVRRGRGGDMEGAWMAPVIAQVMMSLPACSFAALIVVVPVLDHRVSTLPSTAMDWPERSAPPSEIGNSTVAATSSAVTMRRNETFLRRSSRIASKLTPVASVRSRLTPSFPRP